jgi:murein DD-endopeptidase MepM/ murein hydrolase activator NlpD
MATIGGNYVIEDIGHGAYAFYAHLKPGSLKVNVGASVKRGQVMASLGNTGNSSEPHLHFHVIDKPFPLAGRGIPYAFDQFSIVPGQAKEQDDLSFAFGTGQPAAVSNSLVLENTVIDFPQK